MSLKTSKSKRSLGQDRLAFSLSLKEIHPNNHSRLRAWDGGDGERERDEEGEVLLEGVDEDREMEKVEEEEKNSRERFNPCVGCQNAPGHGSLLSKEQREERDGRPEGMGNKVQEFVVFSP